MTQAGNGTQAGPRTLHICEAREAAVVHIHAAVAQRGCGRRGGQQRGRQGCDGSGGWRPELQQLGTAAGGNSAAACAQQELGEQAYPRPPAAARAACPGWHRPRWEGPAPRPPLQRWSWQRPPPWPPGRHPQPCCCCCCCCCCCSSCRCCCCSLPPRCCPASAKTAGAAAHVNSRRSRPRQQQGHKQGGCAAHPAAEACTRSC